MTYYVLTIRNADPEREDDLDTLFWNDETGFGDLASARVFDERAARDFGLVLAADQPVWAQLPPLPG